MILTDMFIKIKRMWIKMPRLFRMLLLFCIAMLIIMFVYYNIVMKYDYAGQVYPRFQPSLTMHDDNFYLNGNVLRFYSGAMHYFRVFPNYWRDRMMKMKAAGLNTIETLVFFTSFIISTQINCELISLPYFMTLSI